MRTNLKNTETAKNAKAAANEMYCGNEHLRWLKVSNALSTAPAPADGNDFEAIVTEVKLFVHGWSDMHVNYM